jgi:undecaprenyl-diphosphatase
VDARPPPDLRKPHPPSLSPRALAVAGWGAFILAGLMFLAIAWNITGRGALVALDTRLAQWLHQHGHRALTTFFFAVSTLHSPAAISAASIAFGAVLARLRQWYWLLTLAVALAGGMLVNTLLKFSYERVRPRFDDPLVTLNSFSFPSGHTAGAVLFYGVLAAYLVSRFYDWRARAACVAGAVAMVVLVALSRMYLGVHYLSDVLAAACSSTGWLVLCLAGGHALVRGKLKLHWLASGVLILLVVAAAVIVPDEWWARFEDRLEAMNPLVALLVFCAAYAVSLLLLIPAWIFPIAAGAVFGFGWGIVAAMLAMSVASLAALLIARYVVPGRIVRLGDYLLGTLLGIAPDVLVKVYLGAAGRGAISHGGPLNWALLGAGIVAFLALSFIVGRKVRKVLKLS